MKKYLLLLSFVAGTAVSAFAQYAFEKGKPNNANYRYLDEYKALKEYIDTEKYPNFKLGIGTTVNDYLNNSTVKNLTNKNFSETVAGNAMKMASCVDGNGNMNFATVTNYVNTATKAGLNVYGHTLAWHSQQPIGWLKKLLADRPAPEIPDAESDVKVYVSAYSKDFRTEQSIGWHADYTQYSYSTSFSSTDGLKVTNTKSQSSWLVQFIGAENINLTKGKSYRMTITIKGSKSGTLHTKLGDWGGGVSKDIAVTTAWKDVVINVTPTMDSNFLLMQCGDYVGDIYIKSVKYEQQRNGKTVTEDTRCLKAHATAKKEYNYDNQLFVKGTGSFTANSTYVFTAKIRADKAAKVSTQLHSSPGTYVHYEALGDINFTTDWQTITLTGTFTKAAQTIAFNLSELAEENTYYMDDVSLKINGVEKVYNGTFNNDNMMSFYVKENGGSIAQPEVCTQVSYIYVPSTIRQTTQEMHDTLVYAMDKWIKGMMNACNGKVKAWDLVNEAISGGGNDGSNNYTLQHSSTYNPNGTWDVGGDAFYWQDYMGDLEYVRQACRLARKYGPEDVKLFINDYNLESDWDGNKKLKSLINWIKKWEADGVTHIDGIGTQMHISYYMNTNTQNSKKKAITNMFTLMAATGKLVRVSEFDMGFVDASGNDVATANMTEDYHKRMADFYEWIIKEYLRIVPPEQQWGICQWCATDSPANSGWRANTPVGVWDSSYYRKHTYAGFVRGLAGGEPTAVEDVMADGQPQGDPVKTAYYNLAGAQVSPLAGGVMLKVETWSNGFKKVTKIAK